MIASLLEGACDGDEETNALRFARLPGAATAIAFRFSLRYFGLYILTTQLLPGMIALPC
jgi:hypothetical protein